MNNSKAGERQHPGQRLPFLKFSLRLLGGLLGMAMLGPALVAQQDGAGRELIGALNLKQAALDGTWTKVDDGVRLVAQQGGRAVVASNLPLDYDLTLEFTRETGNDAVAVILPVGTVSPAVAVSGWKGQAHGMSRVNGLPTKDPANPASQRPGKITNGVKQKLEIIVRAATASPRVEARLNDAPMFVWQGQISDLQPNVVMNLAQPRTLGLACRNGTVRFHSLVLRPAKPAETAVTTSPPTPTPTPSPVPAPGSGAASPGAQVVDLSDIAGPGGKWTPFNGGAFTVAGGEASARKSKGDRGAFLNAVAFSEGTIEFEVKGTLGPQSSFLGVVFHAADGDTYDAVYFRPFNFASPDPERKSHGVQYISHPQWTWQKLRAQKTGQFEAEVNPQQDGGDWFSAKVEVGGGSVRVYVDGSTSPCLDIEQLSDRGTGKVGLWHNGNASFRNLKITPAP